MELKAHKRTTNGCLVMPVILALGFNDSSIMDLSRARQRNDPVSSVTNMYEITNYGKQVPASASCAFNA